MSFSTCGRRLLQEMPRFTQILCAILLAGSLVGATLPAALAEEKQVTPQVLWAYHRPAAELVRGATPWSSISSVIELPDQTLAVLVTESSRNTPLLFRLTRSGEMLWGTQLIEEGVEDGRFDHQLVGLPRTSSSADPGSVHGIVVADRWHVWRVDPAGKVSWKRTGHVLQLDVITSVSALEDGSVLVGGMQGLDLCADARTALVRIDKRGTAGAVMWSQRYAFGQGWNFFLQILPLADGRILGLAGPEGPPMFMGSSSNPCRDPSGAQNLAWLDRAGSTVQTATVPDEGRIEHLVELSDGRLAAMVSDWATDRWSYRLMNAHGATLTETRFGPEVREYWVGGLNGVLDMRGVADRVRVAARFGCKISSCAGFEVTKIIDLSQDGQIVQIWNAGGVDPWTASFSPDATALLGTVFNVELGVDAVVRIPLE